MEKRVILAVVLTIAVIFITNVVFPPVVPPPGAGTIAGGGEPPGDTVVTSETLPQREPEELSPEEEGPASETAPPAFPEAVDGPADSIRVTSDLYHLVFSTRGAALVAAQLLGHLSYAPDDGLGRHVELIRERDRVLGYRIAIGGDTVDLSRQLFRANRDSVVLSGEASQDSVEFSYQFPGASVRFVVQYRFRQGTYAIHTSGRLEGVGDRGYSVLTFLGSGLRTNEADPRDDFAQLSVVVNGHGGIQSIKLDEVSSGETRTADGGPFHWVAVRNKYFLVALLAPSEGPPFGGLIAQGLPEEHSTSLTASLPVPAGSQGFTLEAYVGPQEYGRLNAMGQNLESVNPYGWRWLRPIIRPLVGLVMIVLVWLHRTLSLAYGWVLILFGVMMRVVLFPLYQKSMRAQMAQMQVQPLMKELQAKHKDDPQKLQQEMLKLYKEHNVNPVAGCLPMLLPMPILFALFFVFRSTIEFRGVPFLWLPDLSLKDPLYIIPILMGLSMFLLSWIGQRGMEANPQMKMMTWLMPVVFTGLFMNFPSGLNLYYATSNIASLPQQLYLSRERQAARRKMEQRGKQAETEGTGPRRGGRRG